MQRQLLREVLAYFLSGIAHIGFFGSCLLLDSSPPVPYATEQGRASIASSALIASAPEPEWAAEIEFEMFDAEKPRVEEPKPVKLALKTPAAAEIGPRLELPTDKGESKPKAPTPEKKDEPPEGPKKVEPPKEPAKPVEKPKPTPKRTTQPVEIASISSPSSTPSQAASGSEIDLPRKVATNPAIPYPSDAYVAGQQGLVKLLVTVSQTGTVAAIRIELSSGFPSLDNAALAGVRNWRFEPARRLGQNIAQDVVLPVRFSIGQPQAQ